MYDQSRYWVFKRDTSRISLSARSLLIHRILSRRSILGSRPCLHAPLALPCLVSHLSSWGHQYFDRTPFTKPLTDASLLYLDNSTTTQRAPGVPGLPEAARHLTGDGQRASASGCLINGRFSKHQGLAYSAKQNRNGRSIGVPEHHSAQHLHCPNSVLFCANALVHAAPCFSPAQSPLTPNPSPPSLRVGERGERVYCFAVAASSERG